MKESDYLNPKSKSDKYDEIEGSTSISGHKVLSGELSSTDPNVKAAVGLSALLGLTQFTLSSLS